MTTDPFTDSSTNATSHKPDDAQLQSYLDFACELADIAAANILPYFRNLKQVENKLTEGDFDPVTVADRAAEKVMRELISERYPMHGIFGEEFGHRLPGQSQDKESQSRNNAADSDLTWVLDPIDGTRAFISGLPTWGTLIALYDGCKPVVGVMDQPFTGERFYAACFSATGISSGRSAATLMHHGNQTELRTRDCQELALATMMSTAPDMFNSQEFEAQQKLAGQTRLMRYGGDCYAYCMLAAGHIDLVVEAGLSAYDIQALIPIVEGAGGVLTDWQGGTAVHGGQVIAAATQALHQQALVTLHSAAKKSDSIL